MSASEAAVVREEEVLTRRFSMGRGEFARAMMMRFGMRWWGLLFLLVVAGVVAGAIASDLRWLIVALMVALIVAPMVAAFLYFSFGLRKECYVNVLPHTVAVAPSGFRLTIDVMPPEKSAVDSGCGGVEEEGQDSEPELEPLRRYEVEFSADEIGPYTVDAKGITVAVKASSRGFVRLPYSSFDSEEEFRRTVEIIGSYGRKPV